MQHSININIRRGKAMIFQKTVAAEIIISGQSLHRGASVTMRILPQPANTGIIFRRSDLPGKPQIKADIYSIVDTKRSVTLGKDNWTVSTIEHIMAVFQGLEIDNAMVDINGEELPSGDGSGLYFAEQILKTGLVTQNFVRNFTKVTEPLWVEGVVYKNLEPSKANLIALPSEELEVSFTFTSDHKVTGTQYYHFTMTKDHFMREIAPARTVAFMKELELLRRQGLALCNDTNIAVLVGDEKYENELRYPEEIVRHKILDVLGDLYLIGPLKAHIVAIRSGHTLDFQLAKAIAERTVKQGKQCSMYNEQCTIGN